MLGFALCSALSTGVHAADPVVGKAPRYCNPLPTVSGVGASASGDVTVIRDNGKYYRYCTGGGAWISDDLLNWTFQRVPNVPIAPHVVKYNGAFYMCGDDGPLFKADNPLLRRTEGLLTGTGHGSIVEGPGHHLWQFYTIVLNNPPGGRRIGMDPIAFDQDGNMSVCITDTPQWAPGVVADPAKNSDSGSIPVSIDKVCAMNAQSRFSSEQPGHYAAYAVDNSSGTWWEPSSTDAQPTLALDLSPATRFDRVQLFKIDSVRLLFTGGWRFGFRRGPGRAATETNSATAGAPALPPTDAYQYKIDVSTDGSTYTTVLDQSTNAVVRNTIFEEIPPTKCRFVRLTMVKWPRITPLGIIEFTVFGKPAGSLPAAVPIPAVP